LKKKIEVIEPVDTGPSTGGFLSRDVLKQRKVALQKVSIEEVQKAKANFKNETSLLDNLQNKLKEKFKMEKDEQIEDLDDADWS